MSDHHQQQQQQQQPRWQGDAHNNNPKNSRTSPPAPALPGIATFLQQPLSVQQEHSSSNSSSFHPFSASADYNLQRQQQVYQQQQQQRFYRQTQHYETSNLDPSTAAAGFTSYTHLLDASSIGYQQRTPPTRNPTNSNASGRSPNIRGFKDITITSSGVSSGHHSSEYLNSTSTSATTSGSAPARTHANYKPNIRKTSGGTHHRPLTRTSRYLREVDRRNILRRIEQGEKQANLAKEYQVSRAAISNLKQRRNRKDSSQRDGTEGDSEEKGESESDTGSFHSQQQHQQQQHEQPREQQTIEQQRSTLERTHIDPGHRGHHRSVRRTSSFSSESYHSKSDQPALFPPLPSLSPLRLASSPSHDEQKTPRSLRLETLERVTQANTATTEILFARLVDQRTDSRSFQITKSRIARLLLEQAMSAFPTREVAIPVPISVPSPVSDSRSQQTSASASYLGIEFVKLICAVALSSHQDRATIETGTTLLHEFQVIEPFSETGSVAFASSAYRSTIDSALAAEDCTIQVPPTLHESNVLLLMDTLSSRSAQEAAIAIQATLRSGAQQKDITLVTMCAHEHALAYLLEVFPQLRVVTTKVLPRGDQSSGDILEFLHARLSAR